MKTNFSSPPPNSSFSSQSPFLQTAVDSTSLGEFKTCPRKYQLSILRGRVPRVESVHLTFGLLIHSGIETYNIHRFTGASHEEALRVVVHKTLSDTWREGHPWVSDSQYKNRYTVVRTLTNYLDHWQNDPLRTVRLANGLPAVELSFSFDSGYTTQSTSEPILLCGHFDRIVEFSDALWVADCKTTQWSINQEWFAKFTPDNQFTLYTLGSSVALKMETAGVIVDGVQILTKEDRFIRGLVRRSPFQLEEWHKDLGYYLRQMEFCAVEGHWPQNDKACNLYGGCQYRGVCSTMSKSSSEILLRTFHHRLWDPLKVRVDI